MIGVVGGGQLARMLVQAATQREISIAVQIKQKAQIKVGASRQLRHTVSGKQSHMVKRTSFRHLRHLGKAGGQAGDSWR